MSEHQAHAETKMGSERSFGLVFFAAFSVITLIPLVHSREPRLWAGLVAVVFLAVTLIKPAVLRPLNWLWFKLGLLLGAIVAPIIMSLLFFVAVTPTGLILRLTGKDPLQRKLDKSASSYWIKREDGVGSMKNQF